jgi:hypothetical protein
MVLIATRVQARPAEHPVQHPDPEVETLQDQEAGPQDRDDHEPQLG